MDGFQQQQHNPYMRPPPPVPPPDPHHHYLHGHQQQQQPRPPVPPQPSYYSNHFQYYPPPPPAQPSHSPSPPPQQWAGVPPPPPPLQSHQPAYHQPPPPPPHQHQHPSHHQFPPPPPPYSHPSQVYPPASQEWANSNWGHPPPPQQHPGWDYQVAAQNNTEDWAARARAWAAQTVPADDQYAQSQFTQVARTDEQSRFHEQYQQPTDSHYQDFQHQQYPTQGYQQFPVSAAPSHQPSISYLQENASFHSGPSSNVPDGRMPYTSGSGTSTGATTASPSVHPQEVPSSYSSVTGREEAIDQKDQLYKSLPFPISSTYEGQRNMPPTLPAHGGSLLTEQPFAYRNRGADPNTDLSDQPLEFAPGFTCDQNPPMQSSYPAHHDSAGNVRGLGPVTPSAYPPISSVPSGHQHDFSPALSPPVSGHTVPPFGSYPGHFQSTIPAAGLSYGLGPGSSLHPAAGFLSDAYGISNIAERPKKAPVPNWLKEEIIKNASVITRSSLEHAKEESKFIEDEGVDRLYGKGEQADSRSVDSPRSNEEEEEEDDEADEEVAKSAALNQEIKRVLTEVLLKVTDELFDEIASKVLDEDNPMVEGAGSVISEEHNASSANHKVSPSPPEVLIPKTSAKVLVSAKPKEPETEDVSEKSSSSAPGNVLGLATYASDDDDEDDEIKSSSLPNVRNNDVLQQSSSAEFSKVTHGVAENGSSPEKPVKSSKQTDLETDLRKTSLVESKHTINESGLRANHAKKVLDDSQNGGTRRKLNEDSEHESKKSYSGENIKDAELGFRENEKGDRNGKKSDEVHSRKEKKDDRNGSKEKKKERSSRTGEKSMESESRKRSHLNMEEDRKESEKLHRSNAKEDDNRKTGRTKDKEEDRARHKSANDSSRRKRRRSSSTSSRSRNSKDRELSHEGSDDSKRKTHSKRRNLSPSPVRSRRRQVSRSPHSKHSQRRHSPYSSLESTRKKKSRSKSPVRRHR